MMPAFRPETLEVRQDLEIAPHRYADEAGAFRGTERRRGRASRWCDTPRRESDSGRGARLALASHECPAARLEIQADVLPPARPSPPSAARRCGSTPLTEATVDDHFRPITREHPQETLAASPLLAGDDHQAAAGRGAFRAFRHLGLARSVDVEHRRQPRGPVHQLDARDVPHAGDDRANPVDGLEDLSDPLAPRPGALVGPELGLAHHDRERVVDLLRGSRGQARHRSERVTLTPGPFDLPARSEEHTSELQSRQYLVCRLLLEKKKNCYRNSRAHWLART